MRKRPLVLLSRRGLEGGPAKPWGRLKSDHTPRGWRFGRLSKFGPSSRPTCDKGHRMVRVRVRMPDPNSDRLVKVKRWVCRHQHWGD